MKATGIIRRIDDLGRVVIPREIRRTLGIKDGDPLELYTVDGGVCFKLYDGDLRELITLYDLVATAMYKLDVPTALFYNGHKVSGHPSLSNDSTKVNYMPCGTARTCDIGIGFAENHPTPAQAGALDLLAMAVRQKAIELWDE
jgi:AbrB family looped-hinge helix DNA binding protein